MKPELAVKWSVFDAHLIALWEKGKTAREIAFALNGSVTRNAVLGRIHRLKISGRIACAARASGRRPAVARSGENNTPALPSLAPLQGHARPVVLKTKAAALSKTRATARAGFTAPRPPSENILLAFADGYDGQKGRVALVDLEPRHCRFPIDVAGGPVKYCGLDKEPSGSSYCPHHAVRCVRAPPGRPAHFKFKPLNGVI